MTLTAEPDVLAQLRAQVRSVLELLPGYPCSGGQPSPAILPRPTVREWVRHPSMQELANTAATLSIPTEVRLREVLSQLTWAFTVPGNRRVVLLPVRHMAHHTARDRGDLSVAEVHLQGPEPGQFSGYLITIESFLGSPRVDRRKWNKMANAYLDGPIPNVGISVQECAMGHPRAGGLGPVSMLRHARAAMTGSGLEHLDANDPLRALTRNEHAWAVHSALQTLRLWSSIPTAGFPSSLSMIRSMDLPYSNADLERTLLIAASGAMPTHRQQVLGALLPTWEGTAIELLDCVESI
jgi:hypothetical protein